MVHDGARPGMDATLLKRGLDSVIASAGGAAIAGVPVKDTIKVVSPDGLITDTPPRETLWAAQTPQIFSYELLCQAHHQFSGNATDDAMMVEALGHQVTMFLGSYENLKVTTPEDMAVMEAMLRGRRLFRTGIGFDSHALGPDRRLVLGGVEVAHDMGLVGHSDGDVLIHAIMDALLGAANLGDKGRHFPSSEDQYKDISSLLLLSQVGEQLAAHHWRIANVDATMLAQRPRLGSYILDMKVKTAAALSISVERLSIKVTTTDYLGFVGREEGIAAVAIATIFRPEQ
ncbi:Bifunctional enzyme IspD/IspF [Geodia barretti]|uniref:2-C-methyl-D-erythritol 2,4-cyclodiphosphate synthase n=1 Tax=Geodia barretti TaxID=519541 RepID=A0AA35VY15_GEOBA|nr:Bifunctional enzyme IspD/IspF [Geodia barretti]